MITISNTLILFAVAFACVFILSKMMIRTEKEDDYSKKLAKKIDALSKQQDMLLEAATERASTFVKLENEEFGATELGSDNLGDRIKLIMKKAGITDMPMNIFIISCSVGGIALSGILIYFDFINPFLGAVLGMPIGAYLIYNLLSVQAAQKKMAFLEQFPDAIDMMIRGVKAGLNVARVIKLVSLEAKDPIAGEYRTISQKLDLGIKPEEVLVDAANRIDIEEFRFLVVALVLQIENGGVLAEILHNLSGLVRKRLELGLKLRAMSAEARMSAIVISALPFAFAGIMSVLNPSHLAEFTKPGTGQTLLKVAITLFSMGTFFMLKATRIKV
ncbi:MAG: type II secretion system F family protein [Holosporaceae bacterium]|jgi:Flp pilus assembly protein TadB|nr:type II secretion system F family protein [Holosporaceae bacterium]